MNNENLLTKIESLNKEDIFSVRSARFLTDFVIRVHIIIFSNGEHPIIRYYPLNKFENNEKSILVNITEDVSKFIKNNIKGNGNFFLLSDLSKKISVSKIYEADC